MSTLAAISEPVELALRVGFIAVLYLFLLWLARSALKDLGRTSAQIAPGSGAPVASAVGMSDATGFFQAADVRAAVGGDAHLVVERAPGHVAGMEYEIGDGAVLGRGDNAEIRLEDPYASSRHARISRQGGTFVIEDMGSTNGTYLNEEILLGAQPLRTGDRVRIGDSEFTFMDG
ncbi:MAG TPA: FHA domain-containing protein [Baekduia sp.]|nr:FHA domain-containing protein [Baekduia sp.]